MGGALISSFVAFLVPSARAQNRQEFWPELDLWYRIGPKAQILAVLAGGREPDTGEKTSGQFGLSLDYRETPHISCRIGYSLLTERSNEDGTRKSNEHRVSGDFIYRWFLYKDAFLSDRTRIDLRNIGSSPYTRYRNRLAAAIPARIGSQAFGPYASIEMYFDPRYSAVNRWYSELGIGLLIERRTELQVYLGLQQDTRPARQRINAMGVTLNITL